MKHLEDNLGATGWSLTEEQVAKLNEVSEPDAPYPY
jgi:aryl-alcohol dehydrogenase-like predicted oxidoreductase